MSNAFQPVALLNTEFVHEWLIATFFFVCASVTLGVKISYRIFERKFKSLCYDIILYQILISTGKACKELWYDTHGPLLQDSTWVCCL